MKQKDKPGFSQPEPRSKQLASTEMDEVTKQEYGQWCRPKFCKLLLILLTVFCLLIFLGGGWYVYNFLTGSGLTFLEVAEKTQRAWSLRESIETERVNLLLVGLDKRSDTLEKTLLTDTLILASLDFKNGRLTLIPIPRDLWLNDLKTKVNALYYYGEHNGNGGLNYLLEQLSVVTGQPIDYGLVVDYQNFAPLVDLLGGVDINVTESFVDEEYPNPEYVKNPSDEIPVYIKVQFEKGLNHLDGKRALQYVRSRKSSDIKYGSDLDRSSRQLQLFEAILAKIKNPRIILDGKMIGSLYRFYKEEVQTNFQDEKLMAIFLNHPSLAKLSFGKVNLPSSYSESSDNNPILIHPPEYKYGQWVFEPRTGDWSEVRRFIKNSLEGN